MLPIRYIEPVFRPPSEAQSLILPVTDGCSWNRCSFCEMYTAPQKAFRPRPQEEITRALAAVAAQHGPHIHRVFLADGDATALSTRRLLAVLSAIRSHLPSVRRVSSYCLARNLRHKSIAELGELRDAGLTLAYLGAESGDDEVLRRVNKGEDFASTRDALDKLGAADITRSVMILNGLGGSTLSEQHADASARLINATQPEFLSTLVLSFPHGQDRFLRDFPQWRALDRPGLLRELARFISRLELRRTVFRSDHASNWLALKGTLGADKERLLATLRLAIDNPEAAPLRPDWARGL